MNIKKPVLLKILNFMYIKLIKIERIEWILFIMFFFFRITPLFLVLLAKGNSLCNVIAIDSSRSLANDCTTLIDSCYCFSW